MQKRLFILLCIFFSFSVFCSNAENTLTLHNYNRQERDNTIIYNQNNAEKSVETLKTSFPFPADISNQIEHGNMSADLVILLSYQQGFRDLIEGGQLSPIPVNVLSAKQYQEYLSVDGVTYAAPVEVTTFSCFSFAYDPALLQQYGINDTSLPDNMLEFLKMLTDLYSRSTLTGVRPFSFDDQRMLLQVIATDCAKYLCCGNERIEDFAPTMNALLYQVEVLLAAIEQANATSCDLPFLFTPCSIHEHISSTDNRALLLLSPAVNYAVRLPVVIGAAILNPRSTIQEEALAYIEFEQSLLSNFEKHVLEGTDIPELQSLSLSHLADFRLLHDSYGELVDSSMFHEQINALYNGHISTDEFVQSFIAP